MLIRSFLKSEETISIYTGDGEYLGERDCGPDWVTPSEEEQQEQRIAEQKTGKIMSEKDRFSQEFDDSFPSNEFTEQEKNELFKASFASADYVAATENLSMGDESQVLKEAYLAARKQDLSGRQERVEGILKEEGTT